MLEVAIWAMAVVCGASRARYSRLQVAAATLHLRGYELVYSSGVLGAAGASLWYRWRPIEELYTSLEDARAAHRRGS